MKESVSTGSKQIVIGISPSRPHKKKQKTLTMMITNYLFFALLMGGVQAFLPASVPGNQRSRSWHRPSTIASETSPSTDSERTLQSVSFQGFQGKEEEEEEIPSRLVLQDGSLRLHSAHSGPQDFLNGLNPDEWSATRATEGDESSLFLHTSHAQNLAEHESTLGELLACRRLLACSRTYNT